MVLLDRQRISVCTRLFRSPYHSAVCMSYTTGSLKQNDTTANSHIASHRVTEAVNRKHKNYFQHATPRSILPQAACRCIYPVATCQAKSAMHVMLHEAQDNLLMQQLLWLQCWLHCFSAKALQIAPARVGSPIARWVCFL